MEIGARAPDFGSPPDAPFADRVVQRVRATGAGDVLTYGEVAREVGRPGAARAVGNVLAHTPGLPWWRIVRADGRMARGKEHDQARRLRHEGVEVTGSPPRVADFGHRRG